MLQIDDHEIRELLKSEPPVIVRLYRIKDVTLPGYIVMQFAGLLAALFVLVAANELTAPQTNFGFRIHQVADEWILKVALWTPPAMLVGIALEFGEGVIVIWSFRRKFALRWKDARQRLEQRMTAQPDA